MTQDEKELLLKVICAMLPYGIVVNVVGDWFEDEREPYDRIVTDDFSIVSDFLRSSTLELRPYLRPMSSMTREERQESGWYKRNAKSDNFIVYMSRYAEWLDSKHFDWRTDGNDKTMIEIGLAIEAPNEMYNN